MTIVGGGRMGAAIRAVDWSTTSIGPIANWPRSLVNVLRTMLSSRQPICCWWGAELLQFHNDDYLPLLADRADRALGTPARKLWADVWDGVQPFVDEALAGRGTWTENLPLDMVRDGHSVPTFWTFSYSPLYDEAGTVAGLLNIVTETTESVRDREELAAEIERTKAAELRHRVLQRELSHRMKNTLAMVQAMVSQSLRHATDIVDGAHVATERIQALGRAQDMLTATDWEIADIREVVNAALAPHKDGSGRFVVDGPGIELNAQQAMGLSLAIHELATNATKYGALSNDEGRVAISWSISKPEGFTFEWCEREGPEARPPGRRGFGSRLVTRVVPSYFGGTASIDYPPEGVVYKLYGAAVRDSSDDQANLPIAMATALS